MSQLNPVDRTVVDNLRVITLEDQAASKERANLVLDMLEDLYPDESDVSIRQRAHAILAELDDQEPSS